MTSKEAATAHRPMPSRAGLARNKQEKKNELVLGSLNETE
jgi:hypothetical protein